MRNCKKKNGTKTSAFGSPGRINHNSTPFYKSRLYEGLPKEEFTKWENLDSKLILVKLDDVYYVRKLYFEDGEPYLHSFNDRLYPKIRISDIKKVEYIGKLDSQLYRDMRKVTF